MMSTLGDDPRAWLAGGTIATIAARASTAARNLRQRESTS
jgi:hypothetical protein